MSIISEQDLTVDDTFDNDDISECSTICTFASSCELPLQNKRVQFASHAYCQYTISRYEITLEEALKTWIFADEKAKMMSNYSLTAERMKSGKKAKKNSSYRGLECFHESDADELRETIKSCVDAVLDEQEKQWDKDSTNWRKYAKVSKKTSKASVKLALKRAKEDEREAKKAYRRMETPASERNSRHSRSNRSYSAHNFTVPENFRTGAMPRSILKLDSCTDTSTDSAEVVH
eukprot:CAMPEP_0113624898 /NCGR_PEP_ID=MMETSP0017_2-20120614/12849_1 /TAXON_ID=2856 /ORGANISM="Cylindrotheca closterium" /LENGTH=232 /DNA_ID=CAMNT_0000534971 /DNA_START=58 /DNA_END=756 /DNA_ORIENTATION=+ /assembly_acc=CAM_ASM_000147